MDKYLITYPLKVFGLLIFLALLFSPKIIAQNLPVKTIVLEDFIRRTQLIEKYTSSSFLSRPFSLDDSLFLNSVSYSYKVFTSSNKSFWKSHISLLPTFSGTQFGTKNPYPETSKFLVTKGLQQWISTGIFAAIGPFSIQLQPEWIISQNKNYFAGQKKETGIEYMERFGEGVFSKLFLGQSSLRADWGSFSLGVSSENIWWGPGQFNSLLFSNNAFGFYHLTLNTRRPAKTFLGSFEGQILMGKLENYIPFEREGKEDWRYVNGITFSYQPKWIPGLFLGASRVFQQYSSFNNEKFAYYFPIFEPFQKVRLIDSNLPFFDSSEYDGRMQSQQLTGFARVLIPKAKTEFYFEYGRRDHAVDWREFLLNPEHARAYILGFKKLVSLTNGAFLHFNGEILQQQESINILNRYGVFGGQSWSSHGIIQGFTHRGEMLGPGIGPSSNVQTLETSWVNGIKKIGIRWERLNRHQDVYVRL
uniref:capsule assembly Wzi family protein n=1 Tax=Flavobacterium sp. TaxID=239 RepID=UPI0040493DA5